MKNICLNKLMVKRDDPFCNNFTEGKWYIVIEDGVFQYKIMDDNANIAWYPKRFFKTQQEIRDEKLNELGI